MVIPKGRRTTSLRGHMRPSSRTGFSAVSTERPPVILEWTSFLIRVGYAEQHKPQHIVPWTDTKPAGPKTEREWYYIIGPLAERIWNMLMSSPSTRRVVVLHPPYIERTWEAAMYKGLWNLGVPAIVFVNALKTVPIAMGWSRGMVVQVGMNDVWCMVHADGHALTNTLQGMYD
jgi:hypothetical protein